MNKFLKIAVFLVSIQGVTAFAGSGGGGRYFTSSFLNTVATTPVITSFSPTVGKTGTAVQINGSGFSGVSDVSFNGASASFLFVNDARINAIVPVGASTGFISVTAGGLTGNSASAFVVDNLPPVAPEITGGSPPSPSNNISPTISGNAEPGSVVRIYLNGTCSGTPAATTTAIGAGTFSVSVTLPPNISATLTATATDGVGNVSQCSGIFVYTTDTVSPAPPFLLGTSPVSPSNSNTPVLHGTAAPGSLVRINITGDCGGITAQSVVADSTGEFYASLTLPLNTVSSISATATDQAGNTSACSNLVSYQEDSTPPSPPVFTGSSPVSPANNTTPHILGTAEPGSTVTLYTALDCSGSPAATGIANGGGLFSIQLSVPVNSITTFYGAVTDAAGNGSLCSISSFTYVHDINLPSNSICGRKFEDSNGNGIFEPGLGETTLSGWEIIAVGSANDTIRTTTDAAGDYCFGGLPDASYTVYETLPSGYVQSAGEPWYSIALTPSTQVGSVDFGNFRVGSISGTKFLDADGDGVRDTSEQGLSGWTICLLPQQIAPRFLLTRATSQAYLSLNEYPQLTSLQLSGMFSAGYGTELSGVTAVSGPSVDFKSVSGLSSETEVVDFREGGLSWGESVRHGSVHSRTFDFYLEFDVDSTIDRKFVTHIPVHLSGDGSTPRPEQGQEMRALSVSLYDKFTGQFVGVLDSFVVTFGTSVSAADPICQTTPASGAYSYGGLLPGVYDVREQSLPCWLQTTPDPAPITLLSGADHVNVNFGNQSGGGKICVTKYYDENHNQLRDPGEHPMAGVTFTLTGENPLHTYSSVTDPSGRTCFDNLPADSYTLAEIVPAGYEVILPKAGSAFFTIGGCETDSILWLNAAKYSDSTFRTATPESWSMAVDLLNKPRSVKCKPDKVDFIFNMKYRSGVFTAKFPMVTSGVVRIGKDNPNSPIVSSWTDLKTLVIDFDTIPAPGQTIEFTGRGNKGKILTFSYSWTIPGGGTIDKGTLPAKPARPEDVIKRNIPRLPMPNLHNVGEDLQKLGRYPITIGRPFGPNSVTHLKYTDVLKSFRKLTPAGPIFHFDSTHCLDMVKGKLMTKQMKAYPPDAFGGNRLFTEVLALKLNIIASEEGRFPSGLEDLIYDDAAYDSSPLDSFTVGEICSFADSVLMCNTNPHNLNVLPMEYFSVVRKINLAFNSVDADTVSWSCTDLALKGVKPLKAVRYLRADPGSITPGIRTALSNYAEAPSVYTLKQNYPNPFNPTTMIQFDVAEPAMVSLKVYNTLGQEIATLIDDQLMEEGNQEVEFDASRLTSGVYFYRIVADGVGDPDEGTAGKHFVSVRKMILIK